MSKRLILPGGAGYLGRVLTRYFIGQGYEVVVLTRRVPDTPAPEHVRFLAWDGKTLGDWAATIDGAAAVVNLAGKSVNCRYNEANKQAIYDSRLHSTTVVGEAIAACAVPPPVWLNASSATIYRDSQAKGPAEDRPMDEATGEPGEGFSVDVCRKWEQAFFEAPTPPATRKVALRTTIVFGPTPGGAMDMFRLLARIGLAGPMGGGRQYVSWIHEEDFARAVEFLIARADLSGPVNLAGVVPGRLLEAGFTFRYPTWSEAVAAC